MAAKTASRPRGGDSANDGQGSARERLLPAAGDLFYREGELAAAAGAADPDALARQLHQLWDGASQSARMDGDPAAADVARAAAEALLDAALIRAGDGPDPGGRDR